MNLFIAYLKVAGIMLFKFGLTMNKHVLQFQNQLGVIAWEVPSRQDSRHSHEFMKFNLCHTIQALLEKFKVNVNLASVTLTVDNSQLRIVAGRGLQLELQTGLRGQSRETSLVEHKQRDI
jgi:hypothetical protein